jgi:hypothetical protein
MELFLGSCHCVKYFTYIILFNHQQLYYIGAIISHIAEIGKKRLKTCQSDKPRCVKDEIRSRQSAPRVYVAFLC